MLAPATIDAADGYWAGFLGIPRTRLRPPRPLAVPHAGLGDYRGMYAQAFGGAPVVSLPVAMLERLGPAAAETAGGGLVDDGRWQALFGARTDAVVGPALVAYADAGTFRRPSSTDADVRLLADADRPALDGLRSALPAEEWDHGGSELGALPVAGAFADGALAAVAGYEVWGGRIAHLGIVTHPAHRRRGLGAAAVALAAETALGAGLVAQYRTLASNTPSIGIARRLGFVGYATSLAVRLHAE
jgi:RimJ/RimL family protein N-acetyltransferase